MNNVTVLPARAAPRVRRISIPPGSGRRGLPAYCSCCGCIKRYCFCSCCCGGRAQNGGD